METEGGLPVILPSESKCYSARAPNIKTNSPTEKENGVLK